MISDHELVAIENRAAKATPGPWKWHAEDYSMVCLAQTGKSYEGHVLTSHICDACAERGARCLSGSVDDQDFIAAARSDVPRLTAEIRRLRGIGEPGTVAIRKKRDLATPEDLT